MIEILANYFSIACVVISLLTIVYHFISLLIKGCPRLPSGSKHKHIYWNPHDDTTSKQDPAFTPGNPLYEEIYGGPLSEDRYK